VAERLEVLNPSTVRRQRLGPSVRKLLIESGIDVTTLKGTGPGGAIVKGDVLAAMQSGETSAQLSTSKKREERYQAVAATSQHPAGASPLSIDLLYQDFPTTQIRKVYKLLF
jgi:pyruvate dehydrogenase E2 component (dihydrolipoamide acetyltransferase)